jgi:hypothetical protein
MKGKASGTARTYQEFCRDVVSWLHEAGGLTPCAGDGIDVPFALAGTEITFDVAVKDERGRVVVAECKRWNVKRPVQQRDLFAFMYGVEELRKVLGVEVGALFITSSDFQVGAVKTATHKRVQVATCGADQALPDFVVVFKRYDARRAKTIQRAVAQFHGSSTPTGTLGIVVKRGDGSVEDYGVV